MSNKLNLFYFEKTLATIKSDCYDELSGINSIEKGARKWKIILTAREMRPSNH